MAVAQPDGGLLLQTQIQLAQIPVGGERCVHRLRYAI